MLTDSQKQANFVHLHVHSDYSILKSAARIRNLVAEAVQLGMPALALTDNGNMFGVIEFYQCAKRHGIQPVIGLEANIAHDPRPENGATQPASQLVLLAAGDEGYHNLMRLSSLGFIEGHDQSQVIDFSHLEKYSAGLIALSGGITGEISRLLIAGQRLSAEAVVKKYQKLFGRENFYIELQNHRLAEFPEILRALVETARACNCPVVATNQVHYIRPEDSEALNVILSLGHDSCDTFETGMFRGSSEFYFKSPQEMAGQFAEWPDALANSLYIAERCKVELQFDRQLTPVFSTPDGKTSETYLSELCSKGLERRYGNKKPDQVIEDRLEQELSVIRGLGLCDYFLILWDIFAGVRGMGVQVGPGRGAWPASLVAFLLEITDIDPLKHGLLFERLFRGDLKKLLDFMIDLSENGLLKVMEYVTKKYGQNRVSRIITFKHFCLRGAVRETGRAMNIEPEETERIAMLVSRFGSNEPALRELEINGTDQQKKLLKTAATIDRLVRDVELHACGIAISSMDLIDVVPLCRDENGNLLPQYDAHTLAAIGFKTPDFLELKDLTIQNRVIELIRETRGVDLKLEGISEDDPKTFHLLQLGLTQRVYNSPPPVQSYLIRLKPSCLSDIAALQSLFRPYPLEAGIVDEFIERKNGRRQITCMHPALDKILQETYGIFVYQEQIMLAANILAGFTMQQSRRMLIAMMKKIATENYRQPFVDGAVEKGLNSEVARSIFDLMVYDAESTSIKAHYAAGAVIIFRSAYLKAHFPEEFIIATLTSCSPENYDRVENEFLEEYPRLAFNLPALRALQQRYCPRP